MPEPKFLAPALDAAPDLPEAVAGFVQRHQALALTGACSILAILVFLMEALGGPGLSFGVFYSFPIMCAAWWGHLPLGVLVALEAAILHYLARHGFGNWSEPNFLDEVLRFCFYLLLCSVVCRLRSRLTLERSRASTDPLTGAANGRVFYHVLNVEIDRFLLRGKPFTLAYLDVDEFKKANDQLGHACGDDILKSTVEILMKNTRRGSDTVARLGGDEFAILLPDTTCASAPPILEKLRQALLKEMAKHGWPVTFSIGAATFNEIPGDVDVVLQRVDNLMYQVKRTGKNHVRYELISDTEAERLQTGAERRANVRVGCNRPVRLKSLEDGLHNLARTVDISIGGMSFHAKSHLQKGSVLLIEPLGTPHLPEVMVKVVRTVEDAAGWLHGCELAVLLNMEDLQKWQEPSFRASAKTLLLN